MSVRKHTKQPAVKPARRFAAKIAARLPNKYVRYIAAGLAAVAVGALVAVATHGGDSSQGLLSPQSGQSLGRQIFRAIKVNNDEKPAGNANQQVGGSKPAAASDKPASPASKAGPATPAAAGGIAKAPSASPSPAPVAVVAPSKFSISGQDSYTLHPGDRTDGVLATSDTSSVHWQTASGGYVWSDGVSSETGTDNVIVFLSFPRDTFDGSKITYSVFASPDAKPGSYENSLHITDISRSIDQIYTIRTVIAE